MNEDVLDGGYFPLTHFIEEKWETLTDNEKEDVGSFLKKIDDEFGKKNFEVFEYKYSQYLLNLKNDHPEEYKEAQNKIKKHTSEEIFEIKKDLFLDLILLLDYDSRLEDFEDFL